MKKLIYLLIFVLGIISYSCQKEGTQGPEGPSGAKGQTGSQGPQGIQGEPGNANVEYFQFFISLSQFNYYSSSKIYKANAPSTLPKISSEEAALVYIYIDPIDGSNQWVQSPFLHYYNTSNNTNFFSHSIDSNNHLDLQIRNSNGSAPYSNMNSTIYGQNYRLFIIDSKSMKKMDEKAVDITNFEEVKLFLENN